MPSIAYLDFTPEVNSAIMELQRAVAILGKASENKPANTAFSVIMKELCCLNRLLYELGARHLPCPAEGYTVLDQVCLLIEQTRNLVCQYDNDSQHSKLVFHEAYNLQMNQHLDRLREIVGLLQRMVDDPDITVLSKVAISHSASKPQVFSDFSNDFPSTSLISSLLPSPSSNETADNYFVQLAARGAWLELDKMLEYHPTHCNDFGAHFSLLHMAVMWQNPFAVAMLLGYGADIDAVSRGISIFPKGSSAMYMALVLGSTPILHLLIASGACLTALELLSPQLQTSKACQSTLKSVDAWKKEVHNACMAVKQGNCKQLLNLVAKHTVPLNICMPGGSDLLLYHAILNNDLEMYVTLVEAGASPLLCRAQRQQGSITAKNNGYSELAIIASECEAAEIAALSEHRHHHVQRQRSSIAIHPKTVKNDGRRSSFSEKASQMARRVSFAIYKRSP